MGGKRFIKNGAERHSRTWRISRLFFVLLVGCGLLGWLGANLRAQSATEQELKAAFLYHFAQFVEWPPDAFAGAGAPIVIGVVGNSSFRELLAHTVEYKAVQGRSLLVRAWKPGESNQRCHILFIPSEDSKALPGILEEVQGVATLTIGETEGFAKRGGMINFILSDRKLNFEINQKRAESAGLKISSKLLTLAKAVWE